MSDTARRLPAEDSWVAEVGGIGAPVVGVEEDRGRRGERYRKRRVKAEETAGGQRVSAAMKPTAPIPSNRSSPPQWPDCWSPMAMAWVAPSPRYDDDLHDLRRTGLLGS